MKTIAWILVTVVILLGGFFILNSYIYNEKQGDTGFQQGYRDISYRIDGQLVTLKDGIAEVASAPGSASMITTRYFGNEAEGDLNSDGISDIAFLLTQDGGGSGTFFYIVAALKTDSGYSGTNAVLLGDRIAPQTTEIRDGEIIVNYAERKPEEPMAIPPSMGVSKYLKVVHDELVVME